ncbi:MAG TPA: ABC transporter permease, partial [Bryobacteraceae bacterium]|nr:ABC transporter permease [Bryobacteraceae bacterium]
LGRQFSADEAREGKDRVVIVSDSLWRRRFKSNPGLAGSTIVLGGLQHQVVGVLPPQFAFPHGGGMEAVSKLSRGPEIFRPLVYEDEELTSAALGNFNYGAILRVKAGVPRQRVLAEINAVEAQYPAMVGEKLTLKADMIPMSDLMVGNVRRGLWMLLGAVGAVLLIVCVNLANLLIARATARTREMAIRSALGAGRSRLLGQMLTESVALSVFGGALGLVMAYAGVQALVAAAPADLPRLYEVGVDGTVLAFAVGLAILTGLVSGVLPGLGLSRSDPQDALKSGSHTVTSGIASLKTRQLLIGAEVALSAALLIVAGLLTVSFVRLKGVNKGFDTERVLAVDVSLSNAKYTEGKDRAAYFKRALERLAALPGVSAAGVISSLPARGETWIDPVCLVGDTRPLFERPLPNNRMTSPDYFRTMGVPVLLGRAFTDSDQSQKVAIFSKKLADVLWPGQNPVGRQFLGYNDTPHTLVGVVGDVRSTLSDEPAMIVYYPHWERPRASMSLVLRTTGDPAGLSGGVRTAIRELDADVPVREMKPMEQVVGDSLSQRTFQLTIVLLFAASALIVAGLGIYGIVSYSVSRRRTELGLRSALGARTSNLLWMVVRQAMTPVILGLAAGTAIALSLGGVIESLLFGVKPADVPTIAAVVLVLGSVALAACLGPAYGAVKKNPARTLRFE